MNKTIKDGWMVIVNPKAGSGHGLKDWPSISNQMNNSGIEFSCMFTEHKYHAVELTVKAIAKGFRKIVAVGGDGTINEIVNGIFIQKIVSTEEISLAVIPTGTGNDWMRMYGIPKTYTDAVQSLVNHHTVLQDVGLISYYDTKILQKRYMANAAGMGFDAMVNRKFNRLKDEGKIGKRLYITCTMKELFSYRSRRFKVVVDDNVLFDDEVFSVTVGIGKYNGGGMIPMPNAVIDDGLFDITVIKRVNMLNVLWHFRKLYNGKLYNYSKVIAAQGRNITIETFPESPIEIDGEALGYSTFTFKLVPRSIKVVVGKHIPDNLKV
jgi:YegS/Rv2252/BmrU family lipid kinase